MTSDLSHIIKDDIGSTLASLLAVEATVTETKAAEASDFESLECACVNVNFEFSDFQTVKWKFYIPVEAAAQFEFLMLGGFGDVKTSIDDEIADALNEIVSNICGSMVTNINAQGYEDLGGAKFTLGESEVVQCGDVSPVENTHRFNLKLADKEYPLFLNFDAETIPYLCLIVTGEEPVDDGNSGAVGGGVAAAGGAPTVNSITAMLGEESTENLKLLFDIKFKLSVRLGVKTLLLKDILNWDTGSIIELEQMVNEPLDILANGILIGKGEAVIVDGRFGVKIKKIGIDKIEF